MFEGFQIERGRFAALRLDTVVDAMQWRGSTVRMFGRDLEVPRLLCWQGDGAYAYSGQQHAPAPLSSVIATMLDDVRATAGARFNSVLGNLYRDGRDSVGWHADDEPEIGTEPVIASVSIGAARTFAIRHNASRETRRVTLEHGDLLVMSGASQREYQHAVPKTSRPVGPRVNLTFRFVHAR